MKKHISNKSKKPLALLLAALLVVAMIPLTMGAGDLADQADQADRYTQVAGLEKWVPGGNVGENGEISADEWVVVNKLVTARPSADTWDVKLTVNTRASLVANPIQVALVLDYSGSMTSGSTRLDNLKTAVAGSGGLLDQLKALGNVYISITKFNQDFDYIQQAMVKVDDSNLADLKGKINNDNDTFDATNIAAGITGGAATFTNITDEKVMILMTDGEANTITNSDGTYTTGTNAASVTNANNAAIAAATAADVTIHTVGFDITGGAVTLLQTIASNNGGTYRAVSNAGDAADVADALADAFYEIVRLESAMIVDPIADGFEVVGGAGGIIVKVDGSPNGTISYYGDTVYWIADNGELEAESEVVLTYTVKLKSIPNPATAPDNDGIFNNQPTNDGADFLYRYANDPDNRSRHLAFPEPTVRYETGKLITYESYRKLDAWGIPTSEFTVPVQVEASKNVITDFIINGEQVGVDNVVTMDKARTHNLIDTGYLNTDTGVDFSNTDGSDLLVTNLGGDGEEFDAALPTGLHEVLFRYERDPNNTEDPDPDPGLPTWDAYKAIKLGGSASSVQAGVTFNFVIIAVPSDPHQGTVPTDTGAEATPTTIEDLRAMAAAADSNGDGNGFFIAAKGSYTTKGNETAGAQNVFHMKFRMDFAEKFRGFQGMAYLIELKGNAQYWEYDDRILAGWVSYKGDEVEFIRQIYDENSNEGWTEKTNSDNESDYIAVFENRYAPQQTYNPPSGTDYGTLTVTKAFAGVTNVPDNWSATITVTGPGNYSRSQTITGANRTVSFTGLEPGSYTVTETNPGGIAGYTLESVTGEGAYSVSRGRTTQVTITNGYSQVPLSGPPGGGGNNNNPGDGDDTELPPDDVPLTGFPPTEIVEEDVPLGDMPRTSIDNTIALWFLGICLSIMAVSGIQRLINRTKATTGRRRR